LPHKEKERKGEREERRKRGKENRRKDKLPTLPHPRTNSRSTDPNKTLTPEHKFRLMMRKPKKKKTDIIDGTGQTIFCDMVKKHQKK